MQRGVVASSRVGDEREREATQNSFGVRPCTACTYASVVQRFLFVLGSVPS